jgi:hypothetical protein
MGHFSSGLDKFLDGRRSQAENDDGAALPRRAADEGENMGAVQADISISLDGFVTGPNTDQHPGLGEGRPAAARLGERRGRP